MFGMSKLGKRPKNRRYVVVMAVGGEDKQLAGRIDGGERSNSQATLNRSCCQRLDLVGDK